MPNGEPPDFAERAGEFIHDEDAQEHGGIEHVTFTAESSETQEGFNDWSLTVRYGDGTVDVDNLGTWDDTPSWIWEVRDWYVDEGYDVEISSPGGEE
jgi:hypothetical protein